MNLWRAGDALKGIGAIVVLSIAAVASAQGQGKESLHLGDELPPVSKRTILGTWLGDSGSTSGR